MQSVTPITYPDTKYVIFMINCNTIGAWTTYIYMALNPNTFYFLPDNKSIYPPPSIPQKQYKRIFLKWNPYA